MFGICPRQGRRTDLDELTLEVLENPRHLTLSQIVVQYPELYVRYPAGINRLFSAVAMTKAQDRSMHIELYIGKSGTGKTRAALTKYPNIYRKMTEVKWWENYEGQREVLLDDYEGQHAYREFLRICDHYWSLWEVKGGYVVKNWDRVVITSNVVPAFWYRERDHIKELARRLEEFGAIWLFLEDRTMRLDYKDLADLSPEYH